MRVVPHGTTGRADYFGQIVNRAARYCHGAAFGGQILCNAVDFNQVLVEWIGEVPQEDRIPTMLVVRNTLAGQAMLVL